MGNLVAYSESLRTSELRERVERDGFVVLPFCLNNETVERLCSHLGDTSHGIRNLLALPLVRELAASVPVRKLAAGRKIHIAYGLIALKIDPEQIVREVR
jgi:hypothetical protein